MKEKMLMRLERDRMKARVATLEATVAQLSDKSAPAPPADPMPKKPKPVAYNERPFKLYLFLKYL